MKQFYIQDIKIDVIRKNIKNMYLRVVAPDGRVLITSPLTVNDETVRNFAISRFDWIKSMQKKVKLQQRPVPKAYVNGEIHYLHGRPYLLHVIEQGRPGVFITDESSINLHIRPGSQFEKREQIIIEWYRSELKKKIPDIIEKWEKNLAVKVSTWQIKKMKTRWGSCNIDKKTIHINLELAKKSESCLEYVIVHEMVHILERYHNSRFYAIIDKYFPDRTQLESELCGSELCGQDV
jgi:predicted metal-dependent hydrolase